MVLLIFKMSGFKKKKKKEENMATVKLFPLNDWLIS